MEKLKRYFIQLDLFSSPLPINSEENPFEKRTNIIATRIYFVLVFLSLLLVILLLSVPGHSEQIEIECPTLSEYESYPSDALCPCKEYSLRYSTFLSVNPSFHPVCSSGFVSDEWISALYFGDEQSSLGNDDFRSIGFSFFQTLSMLCRLSRIEVNNLISSVYSESLLSLNLISRSNFIAQISSDTNRFRTNALQLFETRMNIINQLIASSLFVNSLHTSMVPVVVRHILQGMDVRVYLVSLEQEDGSVCNCTVTSSCEAPILKISASINSPSNKSFAIPGLRRRCMPVETCLHSTLECFFNQTCLDTIISYMSIVSNYSVIVQPKSSLFHPKTKIETLAFQLMVDDWSFNASYEKYFERCTPKSCSYLVTTRPTIFQIVGELIGLLSGLCTILRIIVTIILRIVHYIYQKRSASARIRVEVLQTHKYVGTERIRQIIKSVRSVMSELNLFKQANEPEGERQIYRERIATRVYIVLLILTLCILIFYTSLNKNLFTETVINPSESTYFQLESLYSSSLRCQCSQMLIDYKKFVDVEPIFHPVCSSDLVSLSWIDLLHENYRPSPFDFADLFSMGADLFQLLNTFCKIANATISDSLQTFLRRQLVTAEVLREDLFNVQLRVTTEKWRNGIVYDFVEVIDLFRTNMQGNILLSYGFNFGWYGMPTGIMYLYFKWFVEDILTLKMCSCALSAYCNEPLRLFDADLNMITIEGFVRTCTPITSLTQSNFQSFYNQSFIDELYTYIVFNSNNFILRPLIPSDIHSTMNESIQSIADRSFVNQWIEDISFTKYYKICAPSSCTYQLIRHSHPFVILISTIAVIGGLSTLLNILMHIILLTLKKSLNQFSWRAAKAWFSAFNDHNRLSTRLNVVLIIITLVGLYLSNALTKYPQVNEVKKDPSMEFYLDLVDQYPIGSVNCPCSQASIPYNSFINISVITYHQVCSKEFLTYQWLSVYLPRYIPWVNDPSSFSDIIPMYFQLIEQFCQSSQRTVNNNLLQFLSNSLMETSPNPSLQTFQSIIQMKIDKFKMDLSQSLMRILELLREVTHINQLVTIFYSNCKFARLNSTTEFNNSVYILLKMLPVLYDECHCGLSKDCTTSMINSINVTISGLMIGCYPLEALLQSSLQCFYDIGCFQTMTSDRTTFIEASSLILNTSISSRYYPTTKVEEILNNLFIEEWSTNISYEKYYNVCAPSSCSYFYQKSFSPVEIITNLLGLYGGITLIVKHIVVPLIIQLGSLCKRSFIRRIANVDQ